jgi:hypothetical protein
VDAVEVPVTKVFLVLKQDPHFPHECLQGNGPLFAATLESREDFIEKGSIEAVFKVRTPILLYQYIGIGQF